MPEPGFLRDLLILFGLGVIAVVLFHRIRIPSIVGFLLTGIICGPYGFGLISNIHDVEILAEIGVILLLFTVGIEFSLERLARLRTFLFAGGGLQVGLTIGLTVGIGYLLKIPWTVGLFLGMLVSLSSTAIVIRLLTEHGEIDSPHGNASVGILLFQDLCIVPMVLFTPFLGGQGGEWTTLLWIGGKALVFVGVAVLAARYFVPWLLHLVVKTRQREAFLLTLTLLCLGTAWITAQVGLSLALGAFIAGLIISESEYSHQALGEVLPFREVFNSLFFISMGMLFNIHTLLSSPFIVLGGLFAIILGKALVTADIIYLLGYPLRISVVTGLTLAQIGEFSFVLSKVGLQVGLLDTEMNQLFLAIAVGAMAFTPLLHLIGPHAATLLEKWVPKRWIARRSLKVVENTSEIEHITDHVIIIGYGINGRNLARVLGHVGVPYVVIEMNPETVKTERKKGVSIIYGDASRPEILQHAGIERARVAVIAISDAAATRRAVDLIRRTNPGVHIIVRSRYLREMEPLFALGAHEVVPEEFETAIEIFSRTLQRYLVPRDVIERCIREVRQDGYEMFRSIAETHRSAAGIEQFLSDLTLEVYRAIPGSPVAGKRLVDSGLREQTGATVVGIQRQDGKIVANPKATDLIQEEDVVLLLGLPDQLRSAAAFFQPALSEQNSPEARHSDGVVKQPTNKDQMGNNNES